MNALNFLEEKIKQENDSIEFLSTQPFVNFSDKKVQDGMDMINRMRDKVIEKKILKVQRLTEIYKKYSELIFEAIEEI